ncbi:hypothetical protein H5410_024920 [Solanum commersonii]|uniref:Uncharacterized protein n=1 Tax=Solanum commersonii TaxID=4109 RepID=A0A9J5ZNH6_SOLCO|nr:hypothetical protein H5410_024920 [Solanum commersonii]
MCYFVRRRRKEGLTLESSPAEAEVERRSILATNLLKGESSKGFYRANGFASVNLLFSVMFLVQNTLVDPGACFTADFSSGVDACKTVVDWRVEKDRALQVSCTTLH